MTKRKSNLKVVLIWLSFITMDIDYFKSLSSIIWISTLRTLWSITWPKFQLDCCLFSWCLGFIFFFVCSRYQGSLGYIANPHSIDWLFIQIMVYYTLQLYIFNFMRSHLLMIGHHTFTTGILLRKSFHVTICSAILPTFMSVKVGMSRLMFWSWCWGLDPFGIEFHAG